MRSPSAVFARTALAAAVALASALAAPARAQAPASVRPDTIHATVLAPAPQAAPAFPESLRALQSSMAPADWSDLRLRRAAAEQSLGNLRGVIENLEAIDFSTPSFPEADRAAFLLGQAYLRLGSAEAFERLAAAVARWDQWSVYTQWLGYQRLLARGEAAHAGAEAAHSGASLATPVEAADDSTLAAAQAAEREALARGTGLAAGDALAAGLLLRDGDAEGALRLLAQSEARGEKSALTVFLKARAQAAAGRSDEAELIELSSVDTTSALGRDLAGAALLARAKRLVAAGGDPSALLASVPAGSRYAARAQQMLGLYALEHGDVVGGRGILTSLVARDSTGVESRDARLSLAGQSLDGGDWKSAHANYDSLDREWSGRHAALEKLNTSSALDSLWPAWEAGAVAADVLPLDALPGQMLAARLAEASVDLTARPGFEMPTLASAAPTQGLAVAPPNAEEMGAVNESARRVSDSRSELERTRWSIAAEQESLAATRDYFGFGGTRVQRERGLLQQRSALLDSLGRTLDAVYAQLRSVHDESRHRILERTLVTLKQCENNLLWMTAMHRFYVDGPNQPRATYAPPGSPSPATLLMEEETLVRAVDAYTRRLRIEMPDLIARSYEQVWGPRLIDRVTARAADASGSLALTKSLAASIDSNIAAAASSPMLRLLAARETREARATDSLVAADVTLRRQVAASAVARARVALDGEREAIDYGLATSAYALSVHLSGADSLGAPVDASPSAASAVGVDAAPDTSRDAATREDDLRRDAWRAEAIGRLQAFLQRHPDSFARAEMRFQLADLLLIDARQSFHEQMAAYVAAQAEGHAAGMHLPVLADQPTLALYRKILAEDKEFPHVDAVLFNSGMILADDGDAESQRFFQNLVTTYPQSRFCQEAYLRMGDLPFYEKRYADCIPLYQHAAAGADASLRAIALYKMGSAQFNEDQFIDAADAFRSVVDLYESGSKVAINADIRHEAETYLMHSLARAGGAKAFAEYFDRVGSRPYERNVLMALGQHFRRYSLFSEAIATDELSMTRYPNDPDALISAQRLTETYRRADKAELGREAQLKYAERFAPASPWYQAQQSDSVRQAGSNFARASWKDVARFHHLEARKSGSREDWQKSLAMYEQILAHWPDDPDAATIALNAGEAGAQLGDYPKSLRYYSQAAQAGSDSVAQLAMLQRVAVTDTWYENSRKRAGAAATPLGSDSLAHAVLATADELLQRFPDHPSGGDVVWREGNLAFAHGWYDRAAADFGRMNGLFPNDDRAPLTASLRADALFRLGSFADAGAAYDDAATIAHRAGRDTLANRAAQAVPICYYRAAEAAVAADSTDYAKHAELFEGVATRWPQFEHANVAQYRAGLAYLAAGKRERGVLALQTLIQNFPKSEFVKDAHLQIAKAWESGGDKVKAADAYAAFAERFPDDESAGAATLKAADLFEAAGLEPRADDLRLAYIRKHPEDVPTAMEVYEGLARRDLKTVGPNHPISALIGNEPLATPAAVVAKGKKTPAKAPKKPVAAAQPAAPTSRLAEYLKLAKAHPDLASHSLLAEVRFQQGEEARMACDAVRLRQPLDQSIKAKQALLDRTLAAYRASVDLGVTEWSHASAFRIGQSLVAFGEAVEKSEPPADLSGNDLAAYRDVLSEQSQKFYDRGEGVWEDLLRQKTEQSSEDTWVVQARQSLWQRLANRFYYKPEVEFPLVAAVEPDWHDYEKAAHAKTAKAQKPKSTSTKAAHDSTKSGRKGKH